jgi:hypothetical protein
VIRRFLSLAIEDNKGGWSIKQAMIAIVGGSGFRAQSFLQIAEALPERFAVCGTVVRDEEKGRRVEERWGVPAYRTLDELLRQHNPDYVVLSVSKNANVPYIVELAERGIPVLAETPPAGTLSELVDLYKLASQLGARVQIAEQYVYQPMQAARLAVARSGRLGEVTQATVSISHMYHAVSLIRNYLDVGFEDVSIRGMSFESPWLAGPDRQGPPLEEKLIPSRRDLAWFDFGDKLGVYDFTTNQHRSWIRSNHVSVRGTQGEIFDQKLSVMEDYRTPLHLELKRITKGEYENMEGHYMQGILAGESWVYRNPFAPARLFDDEIAMATSMAKMADYAQGGPSFYSLAEASQDHYLGLLMEEAIQTGTVVRSTRQVWASEEK